MAGAWRPCALAWACAAAALSLSSCSSDTPHADLESQHAQDASSALEQARTAGADPQQLEVLESVAASGRDVLYPEYHDAVMATIECLAASGFAIDGPREDRANGQVYLSFGYAPPEAWTEEQMGAVYGDCQFKHMAFVDALYQTNTAAKVYVDDEFKKARPEIIACLAEYGYEAPEDGTMSEIAPLVIEVRDLYGEDADCYARSGFSAALNG